MQVDTGCWFIGCRIFLEVPEDFDLTPKELSECFAESMKQLHKEANEKPQWYYTALARMTVLGHL